MTMASIAGATIASTVAGVAGSAIGGAMQADAARAGQKGAQKALLWGWNTGAPYYDQARADLYPYMDLGQSALWQIRNNMGWNPGQAPGSGMWEQPMNLRTAAAAAGVNYDDIIRQITGADIKKLMGVGPKEAFGPITGKDISAFTGIGMKNALQGYSPMDTQRLAGIDLKGLFGNVGSVGLQNPKPRPQPAQSDGASTGGLKPAQQKNFDRLQQLAMQGKLNDNQQQNYLRLLNLMQG